jgi:hypothetical protein
MKQKLRDSSVKNLDEWKREIPAELVDPQDGQHPVPEEPGGVHAEEAARSY